MVHLTRRTAPRVRDGEVQRKNRSARTPNYYVDPMPSIVIDRRNPGRGCRHVVIKDDVRRFVKLLPDWDELQIGLNAIVLDHGHQPCLGWHVPGVVALCAWDKPLDWEECYPHFFDEHHEIFDKLGIPVERGEKIAVRFTPAAARAFALIHVLVHELGHHHDRMTTRSRRQVARGEPYAEAYARRHEDEILARYRREFDF